MSIRFTLFLAAVAVMAAGVVLAQQATYGVGLIGDAITYISAARSLLDGGGGVFANGSIAPHWPPLYPILLAGASLWVFDPIAVAGPVNAAALGLAVFGAGWWLRRRIASAFLAAWAVLAIALSFPLTYVASNALSEAVFILFAVLALIAADHYLRSGRRWHLILAAVGTALACATRYPGVTVIAVVSAALLFQPGVALPRKVGRIAAYTAIAVAPLGVWMLRNMLLTGTPTGSRGPRVFELADILRNTLGVLADIVFLEPYWTRGGARLQEYIPVFPGDSFPAIALLATGLGLLALAGAAGYVLLRPRQSAESYLEYSPLYLCGGLVCCYVVFLLASQALSDLEPAGVRYLSPVCVPLTLAVAFLADRVGRWRITAWPAAVANRPIGRAIVRSGATPLYVALLAVLALWLALSASLAVRHTIYANSDDYTGSYVGFAQKDVVGYLQDNPIAGRSYSNESIALYLLVAGPQSYDQLGFTRQWLDGASPEWAAADDDIYIVWFHNLDWWPHNLYEYGPDDLRALPGVATVAEFTDGVVLKYRAGAPQ